MPKKKQLTPPQQTLVRETSEMLFHSAQGEPILSLAGIWSEGGGNVCAVAAEAVGLTSAEIDELNQSIYTLVNTYLDRSPNLVRVPRPSSRPD